MLRFVHQVEDNYLDFPILPSLEKDENSKRIGWFFKMSGNMLNLSTFREGKRFIRAPRITGDIPDFHLTRKESPAHAPLREELNDKCLRWVSNAFEFACRCKWSY